MGPAGCSRRPGVFSNHTASGRPRRAAAIRLPWPGRGAGVAPPGASEAARASWSPTFPVPGAVSCRHSPAVLPGPGPRRGSREGGERAGRGPVRGGGWRPAGAARFRAPRREAAPASRASRSAHFSTDSRASRRECAGGAAGKAPSRQPRQPRQPRRCGRARIGLGAHPNCYLGFTWLERAEFCTGSISSSGFSV